MDPHPQPRAGRRQWLGLAVLALATTIYSLDFTILHLAVPALTAELRPSSTQLLWIVDVYGFVLAGSLITMGALGDRIGRRRLLTIGAAGFGAASLLAAFSTSAWMLIAARALLGLAGATLAPSTLSLIRTMFVDASQRTFAVGIWVTGFSVGALVGPPLGGVLLEFFWWGSVFLVAVPAMALLVASGRLLLPEYRDPDPRPFDPVGTALSLLAVLAAIYGLKRAVHDGLAWPSAASILLGLGVGVAFVRRDRRRADPLIDARLLRMPAFGVSLGAYFLVTFVAVGALLFVFQYLQLVLGLSALTAALWAIPAFLAFVAGSLLTPPLVRRVRPAYTMTFGLLLAAAGYALLTRVDAGSGARPFIVATVVANLGEAPVFTLANDLIIGAAPTERAGAAAALSETGSELGGALGVAILGSLAAALYRGGVADAVPAGLSPDRAAAARDTLGGAVSVADTLPVPVARELLQTSRDAFVHGLHVAALTSALLAAGLAVLIGVLLRGVGRPGALSDE